MRRTCTPAEGTFARDSEAELARRREHHRWQAGNFVAAKTGGGQIIFGEVRGSCTNGWRGIRVMYVSGRGRGVQRGKHYLTRGIWRGRRNGSGTITAWINPGWGQREHFGALGCASQLTSGAGIVVSAATCQTLRRLGARAYPSRLISAGSCRSRKPASERYTGNGRTGGGPVLRSNQAERSNYPGAERSLGFHDARPESTHERDLAR